MANPQIENGHTRIANEILERVSREKLNGTQLRILLVIWRYTYGFQRKKHRLSLTFISNAIGGDRRQIQRDLKVLADRKIIIQTIEGQEREIGFNKNYNEWISEVDKQKPNDPSLFDGIGEDAIGENTIGESTNSSVGKSTAPPLVSSPTELLVNTPPKKERKKTIKKNGKKKNASAKAKAPDFIDECLDIWKAEYGKSRGDEYLTVNKGKDREGIGKLVGLLRSKFKENEGREAGREEMLERVRLTFNHALQIKDKFFRDNLTPMLLIAKINEIRNIIKNGNGKKQSGITDEYLKRVIKEELNIS